MAHTHAAPRRPSRTVKRESAALRYRGRPLILIIPPDADVIAIREKGRRTAFELDVLSIYSMAAKKEALRLRAERQAKRKGRRT